VIQINERAADLEDSRLLLRKGIQKINIVCQMKGVIKGPLHCQGSGIDERARFLWQDKREGEKSMLV
jgi:hypothetical protein